MRDDTPVQPQGREVPQDAPRLSETPPASPRALVGQPVRDAVEVGGQTPVAGAACSGEGQGVHAARVAKAARIAATLVLVLVLAGCGQVNDIERQIEDAQAACVTIAGIIDAYPWMAPRIMGDSDEALRLIDDIESDLRLHDFDAPIHMFWISEGEREIAPGRVFRYRCSREVWEDIFR